MTWFFLLQKRLLKKPDFIVILLLILPIVLGFKSCSSQKTSVLSIALFSKDSEIIRNFSDTIENVNFILCSSKEDAKNLVIKKEADSAWIFDNDFAQRIEDSGKEGLIRPVVTVFEAEESTALAFSRELLYKEIYPLFSYQAYKYYVTERFGEVSEHILTSEYNRFASTAELFVNETVSEGTLISSSYLTSPLRGLLSVWFMLCAFAATLYFMQDSKRGAFIWLHLTSVKKSFFSLFMIFLPLVSASLIFIMAIVSTSFFGNFLQEISAFLLFLISAILFSNILRLVFRNEMNYCAVLPLLILIFLVFCPIFLNIHTLRFLQYMLPPFYYLNASQDSWFFIPFLVYDLFLFILHFTLSVLASKN